jgi:hypothetical protein
MARKQKTRSNQKNRTRRSNVGFGAVSQINTAPVSVGNSVRGSKPRVTQTTNGARVLGRDFAFSLSGTAAAVTNWELIGGMPITPAVLPSSVLRNYCQMFQKYKVNRFCIHYITSSPTSQAGDILFYYERDRYAPLCDYSNSSFLPYVLSDPATVIGPQWTNHSVDINPVKDWKSTLYANQSDINEDATGTFFLFSKTNAANSPGYLLIDYDIEFKELSINPRAGALPVARGQSTFVALSPEASCTAGNPAKFTLTAGKNIAGVTSAAPTGVARGDIFKVHLQVTASQQANVAWTGTAAPPTAATFLTYPDGELVTIDDGFTFYMITLDGTTWVGATTVEACICAFDSSAQGTLEYGFTATGVTAPLCAEMHLVRNLNTLTQSSY